MLTVEYFIALILIGVVAGFASGLLGVGGGFLIVPFQYFLLQSIGVSPNLAMLISLATSLAIIIPTASSGAYKHSQKLDNILIPGVKLGIFGIIGSVFGAFFATTLPSRTLELIFGVLLLFISIRNIFSRGSKENDSKFDFNWITIILTGLFVGFFSGLLGIGGGIFLIIILTVLLGFSMIQAIGTSSVFISLTAIGGTVSYIISGWGINTFPYSFGYVSLINLFVISCFSVPLAQIGAKYAHKLPEKRLKQVFGILVLYISFKMLGFLP